MCFSMLTIYYHGEFQVKFHSGKPTTHMPFSPGCRTMVFTNTEWMPSGCHCVRKIRNIHGFCYVGLSGNK